MTSDERVVPSAITRSSAKNGVEIYRPSGVNSNSIILSTWPDINYEPVCSLVVIGKKRINCSHCSASSSHKIPNWYIAILELASYV